MSLSWLADCLYDALDAAQGRTTKLPRAEECSLSDAFGEAGHVEPPAVLSKFNSREIEKMCLQRDSDPGFIEVAHTTDPKSAAWPNDRYWRPGTWSAEPISFLFRIQAAEAARQTRM
jgi:hypothetical protein